jgi:hypothetical protein
MANLNEIDNQLSKMSSEMKVTMEIANRMYNALDNLLGNATRQYEGLKRLNEKTQKMEYKSSTSAPIVHSSFNKEEKEFEALIGKATELKNTGAIT